MIVAKNITEVSPTSAVLGALCTMRMRCCEIASVISPSPASEAELVRTAQGIYEWIAWQKVPAMPDKPAENP
jgi:lipoate synthase